MEIATSIRKRARKHFGHIEKSSGNSCDYYQIEKHKYNFYHREVMHNKRNDTWSCITIKPNGDKTGCKYMVFAYGSKDRLRMYCSHIAACYLHTKENRSDSHE